MKPIKCKAKNPLNCRYHTPFKTTPTSQDNKQPEMVLSNGVMVIKNKFQTGNFIKTVSKKHRKEKKFDGTWKQLEQLVTDNKHNFEPGAGSVDNDVILVNVPPEGFRSSIIEITEENKHLVEERDHVRVKGEAPVKMRFIKASKPAAKFVQIVVYRADVLAKDNNRTTDAEWEIIAINCGDIKNSPMHPTTMLRNSNNETGGTYREYTKQQWDEAYAYWDKHAFIDPS